MVVTREENRKYSRLGLSDMEISRVGLGTLAISGRFRNADDDASLLTMHRAIESGMNWIHTAPSYGTGYGEIMVGRFLKEISQGDRPYVFTTVTWVFDRSEEGDDAAVRTKSLAPDSIRKQVEGSLRRLGVERIDLLQFHWPDLNTPIEESWECMNDLVQEGKVRAIGLSNHPLELIKRCEKNYHVDALQQPLSLLDRSMNGPFSRFGRNSGGIEVLEWAHRHQTGVLIFAPLQHGILAGKYNKKSVTEFADSGDPLRPKLYWFQEPVYSQALNFVNYLTPIAERHQTSVAAVSIAWALCWEGVTGAICGARKPEQLDAFLDAWKMELSDEDLDDIEKGIRETELCFGTSGDGPYKPIRKW